MFWTSAVARSSCSGVTPSTPLRSTGCDGSNARGQSTGVATAAAVGFLPVAVGVAVIVAAATGAPAPEADGSFIGMAVGVVRPDEHRRQRDDADGERRHPEANGRHLGAAANQGDEGSDDGNRPERGARRVGELRVLGDFQPVDPADAPQPCRAPRRHGTEVDESRDHCGQTATLDQGEQADSDLSNGDGDEQAGQRDVLGVQPGNAGMDRPGPDRSEAGELHDADSDRHRPLRPQVVAVGVVAVAVAETTLDQRSGTQCY